MLAMSAVALLVVLPNHPAGRPPSEDAGVFFYGAQRILHGGLPYRDIWDHKPPGVYAIDAIGLALGGTAGVWAVQLVSLVVAAVASLRATRTFGGGAATFGTFAWLVGAPRLFLTDGVQTSYVEFYGLPLQLVALALLPRDAAALRPGGPTRRRASRSHLQKLRHELRGVSPIQPVRLQPMLHHVFPARRTAA